MKRMHTVVLLSGFFPFPLLVFIFLFLLPPSLCPACPAWIPLCHVTFANMLVSLQPCGLQHCWTAWVRSVASHAAASLLGLHLLWQSGSDAVWLMHMLTECASAAAGIPTRVGRTTPVHPPWGIPSTPLSSVLCMPTSKAPRSAQPLPSGSLVSLEVSCDMFLVMLGGP